MIAKVEKAKLLKVLKTITRFCGPEKAGMHFEWIRIEPRSDNVLGLTVANYSTVILMDVEANILKYSPAFCVEAKLFKSMIEVAQASDGLLDLALNEAQHTLEIYGESSLITLHVFSTDEFEHFYTRLWPETGTWKPALELVEAVKRVEFCTSRDEARPVLQCVYFNSAIAATDGFKIARLNKTVEGFEGLLHHSVLRAMDAVFGDDPIGFLRDEESSRVIFRSGNAQIAAEMVEGNFPDYNAIFPKGFKFEAVIKRTEFLRLLRMHQAMAKLGNYVIRMEFTGNDVKISTHCDEFGKIESTIPLYCEGHDTNEFSLPFNVAANVNWLRESVARLTTDEFSMKFNANNSPILIEPFSNRDPLSVVVMPMHLG